MSEPLFSLPRLGAYKAPPRNQRQPLFTWKSKGYLGRAALASIAFLASLALLMIMSRIFAMPGMPIADWPLLDKMVRLGVLLNNTLTLTWVPVADRDVVIYLLMLPIAALLISITRLTLGLRMLGYRSVLIAVGFNEIGVMPSLIVIVVVVGIIIIMRPTIRRARLPLYARVSMALGITACVLISALFMGAMLRSELIWSLAFFPVIILAMMAESVAATLERENLMSAFWRLTWTIVVALTLFILIKSPAVLDILLRFPELMLLQLLGIVLVSEYLDLRLFQDWQNTHIGEVIISTLYKTPEEMQRKPRVAVIRNRSFAGTIGRLGPAASDTTQSNSVQHLIDALRDEGYNVKVVEGDRVLLRELRNFLVPHPRSGMPGGVALNLSTGIQGYGRHIHVPAMLEMAGVAYTGPDPMSHARLQDQYALFTLLRQAGVSVPEVRLLDESDLSPHNLVFPLRVFPRSDPDAAITVKTISSLGEAIAHIRLSYHQEILIQSKISGTEFRVAIFGNTHLEYLPILKIDAASRKRECPAPIDNSLADRIRECARLAYRVAGCRDYARIDLCLGNNGDLMVSGVQTQAIFARKGSLAIMMQAADLSWSDLLRHIVELAAARTGAELATKFQPDASMQSTAVTTNCIDSAPDPVKAS
ncbi:MAG: 7TM domain-containing protein [Nitrosomonas sp.]